MKSFVKLDSLTKTHKTYEGFICDQLSGKNNITVILCNKDWIKKAVQERYSLRKIYFYLKKDGTVTCGYQNFYQICKKYIFKNNDLKNVRSDDEISSKKSISHVTNLSYRQKTETVSCGLPKNSFDNWNGDSRDFIKDLL
ncbi:MAG: hypothetical protein IJ078_05750 [Succinivibrionaceae bacterium]|nr:hypothetical protein [Succinivibrionaceae bacterium]